MITCHCGTPPLMAFVKRTCQFPLSRVPLSFPTQDLLNIYIYIYHQSLSFVRKNRVSYVPPQNSLSAQCFGIICAQFCTASYAWFPFEWFARELGLPVKYIVLGTAQFDSKDFFAMNPLCVLSIEKRRIFNIT